MRLLYVIVILVSTSYVSGNIHFFKHGWDHYDEKYSSFPESKRREKLEEARQMFHFGYDNYMTYAFPKDELDPIHCTGRGPDYDNPSNININDVLGDYALTLVDALDTLAIMGNSTEFKRAVQLVLEYVSFDKPNTVQVFEANIRVLGALLSAHLIMIDPDQPLGPMAPADYDNELLDMANDLAARLLPAFDETATGIPYPRVNLRDGVPKDCTNQTCTSGAGTLLLEFGLLSRMLKDPVYDSVARRAVNRLWNLKSNVTGLFGNVIDIQTGTWVGVMSGLGAGLDSFYEYLLKAFILFGEEEDLKKFNESYETIKYYMRRGRKNCNEGQGYPPIYVNVNMKSGEVHNNWIDALQAAWPGVQVLNGDIEEAICTHALYYAIWQKFGALPERYNWNLKMPEIMFYPLRPELIESTYLLYQATKNPFYLHVGSHILDSLNNHTKVKCGYATIHDVTKKDLEDRMESFFLSETCKYLYLLFDTENHVNKQSSKYIFSTEGHIFPIKKEFQSRPWEDFDDLDLSESTYPSKHSKKSSKDTPTEKSKPSVRVPKKSSEVTKEDSAICQPEENPLIPGSSMDIVVQIVDTNFTNNCDRIPNERTYFLPIENRYLHQVLSMVGLN